MTRLLVSSLILFLIACKKNEVVRPSQGTIIEAVYGLGTVESDNVFHAKAAIISFVKEFYVKEGQDVLKGQKLFLLDSDVLIRSPISGRVTDLPLTIHENVFPQTTILTVVDLKNIFLSVSLDQEAALRLKKGMKAEATFEFFRNKKLVGEVETVYSQNDQFISKVRFSKWPEGILTGMTADVSFEISRKESAIIVPTKAITNGYLTIKKKGKTQKIKVNVGLKDEDRTEVINPHLSEEDEVILP